MAIPDQVRVPSLAHAQRFTPSGFVANSLSVLNPNDGVVYVARNRDCIGTTVGQWDWKVPSQSYAYLPGPFQSVGFYYVDLSGTALPGDISSYASEQKLDWPHFQSIGRAAVSSVTTLDIGMGNKPVPPAANNIRLWADGNGDLHIEMADGSDNLVYDSSNIGTVALGGDLYGTIAVAHIGVQYGNRILMRDSTGALQPFASYENNDHNEWAGTTNLFKWFKQDGGLLAMQLNGSAGNLVVNNDVNAASISLLQGANQVIYWRDGSHYLQYAPAGVLTLLAWTHDFQANALNSRTGELQLRDTNNRVMSDGSNLALRTNGSVYLRNPSDTAYTNLIAGQVQTINGVGGALSGNLPNPGIASGVVSYGTLSSDAKAKYAGGYNGNLSWSTTTAGWVKTPISFTATLNANKCILWTWNIHWMHNGTQANPEFGLSMDSMGSFFQQLSVQQNSFANQVMTCSGAHVFSQNELPSGTHTFDFYVYNGSGTFTLWSNDRHQMSVSEFLA